MRDIIFLKPAFTFQPWGGTKLRDEYGYDVSGDTIGECWGISAHAAADCTVSGGEFDGMRLSELWDSHRELFGDIPGESFPLLVKIIDARLDLSVQVHPDDEYARSHENGSLGKTECWVILDCPENASLIIGHRARTKEELGSMALSGRWRELIREVPVKRGDFIQIDPGTIHAIRGGITVLETQQNSDITYRVYDFDRVFEGKKRELHIEKSLEVIKAPDRHEMGNLPNIADGGENQVYELIRSRYYRVSSLRVRDSMSFAQEHPFLNMSVIYGSGSIGTRSIKKGDHFIVPAGYGRIELSGRMDIVMSTVD